MEGLLFLVVIVGLGSPNPKLNGTPREAFNLGIFRHMGGELM